MADEPEAGIDTDRLLLRPWMVADATVLRRLWEERDPRVPPHRRIDAAGRPTLQELEARIRDDLASRVGFFAVERRDTGAVIGYCGLVDGRAHGEPELAFELLRREWAHGFATEASTAVVEWAGRAGHRRLWATVRAWNTASRRVLAKSGFTETGRTERSDDYGDNLVALVEL